MKLARLLRIPLIASTCNEISVRNECSVRNLLPAVYTSNSFLQDSDQWDGNDSYARQSDVRTPVRGAINDLSITQLSCWILFRNVQNLPPKCRDELLIVYTLGFFSAVSDEPCTFDVHAVEFFRLYATRGTGVIGTWRIRITKILVKTKLLDYNFITRIV